jgi:hypothetical protein
MFTGPEIGDETWTQESMACLIISTVTHCARRQIFSNTAMQTTIPKEKVNCSQSTIVLKIAVHSQLPQDLPKPERMSFVIS